jgi:20S proteasome subunit alpha 1
MGFKATAAGPKSQEVHNYLEKQYKKTGNLNPEGFDRDALVEVTPLLKWKKNGHVFGFRIANVPGKLAITALSNVLSVDFKAMELEIGIVEKPVFTEGAEAEDNPPSLTGMFKMLSVAEIDERLQSIADKG